MADCTLGLALRVAFRGKQPPDVTPEPEATLQRRLGLKLTLVQYKNKIDHLT